MTALTTYGDGRIIAIENFGDSVIEEFIASRHGSATTSKTYKNVCRVIMKYFATKGIAVPTTADVDAFINSLRADEKSDSTIRLYYTVCKLFFAFLDKNGKYPDVAKESAPLKLRKSNKHKKQSLNDKQAQSLLNAVKGEEITNRRDRAIIALALQTGVRTVEIERANLGDFYPNDDGEGYLLAVRGKGHETADDTVRVAPPVAALILSYLELRGDDDADKPLFISTSNNNSKFGNRYSAQSIQKMIKGLMLKVGIRSKDKKKDNKRITAHSCRHYAATTAIESGVDIREVSEMLRHTSVNITAVYLHDLSAKTRRAELAVSNKLFGI